MRCSERPAARSRFLRAVLLWGLLGTHCLAQTPTLVQHISSARDNTYGYSNPTYRFFLPNPALAGNCLVLRFDHTSVLTTSNVETDKGDSFTAGPSVNTGGHVLETFYTIASAGSQVITITTKMPDNADLVSGDVSEFYNTSCAVDASGSSSSRSVTLSPTSTNDLIWQSADDVTALQYIQYGGEAIGPPITSMTAGTGYRMLQGNASQGTFAQYQAVGTAGSQTVAFQTSDTDTWQSAAIAFKSALTGTAPQSTGMRIVNMYGEMFGNTTHTMYVPCSGNLMIGLWSSPVVIISGASSSGSGSWSGGAYTTNSNSNLVAQIFYGQGMNCSSQMSVTPTYSVQGSGGLNFLVMMDVAGASSSAHDLDVKNSGYQTSGSSLTTDTITPSTANGLVVDSTAWGACTAMSASPGLFAGIAINSENSDNCAPTYTPNSTMNEDNGLAFYYNPNTAPATFTYTNTGSVEYWASVASAFKAAQTTGTPVVNPPTGLTAVAQ